ncbi:MAG: BamA/TamA family outer membrane protein [Bacteroidetes bacterium]|nr:BamA/TamA family outer membrane protein [Bacteroidota bacterium]MBK9299156.1 BamA/TamA family outer membrane protein [Bacteroidota bacterium]
MKKGGYILFFAICLLQACGVKRFIPADEKLYKGATIKIEKAKGVKTSVSKLRKKIKIASRPKRNKFILGQPYKVWWWFVIGEPKKKKGFRTFLRDKLGEPPVLSNKLNPKLSAENMQSVLENNGYFHSVVEGDSASKGYLIKAQYHAKVLPQYDVKEITWVSDKSPLLLLLEKEQQKESLLSVGKSYNLEDITAERSRLDMKLKTQGYYFFNPDFLMAYADSTIGNHGVHLYLNLKQETPVQAKHPYTIDNITLYPNYNLLSQDKDTLNDEMITFDSLRIKQNKKFNPKLFKRVVTFRPGSIYSSIEQNKTLNRFINLGTFKFVKNQFTPLTDTNTQIYTLGVTYYLTPTKRKSFQAQLDAFSKENRYIGSQLSLNWRNRNTFKNAELLTFKTYGGLEISFDDSLKKNNNYRVGAELALTFPRFIIPFVKFKESNFYTPHTRLLLGYEWFRKQDFYTKNVFRTQYEYNWKETSNKEHTLAPVAISYIRASNVTPDFYAEAAGNPTILTNVYSEAILGSFYSYTLNTLNPLKKDLWYLNASVDLSGNIAGLITGAKNVREKMIFNTPFAQYAKGDLEIRYQKKLNAGISWANRIQIGISLPYNNSNILPFSKQYVVGGSNSIRGFRIKQLGPGSYLPTADDQRYFLIIGGDYKFLLNSEIRIPLIGSLGSAVFIDAGNMWTKDTFLFGKAGQLKKSSLSELAVATGFGLRYDLKVLLIRLDLGMPLRKPFYPEKERWVLNSIDVLSGKWRRENLILNIAIGYPF